MPGPRPDGRDGQDAQAPRQVHDGHGWSNGYVRRPEQKAKADAIHSDFRKKAVRAAADVKVAHIELHELLAADPVNLDKVRAKVNELVQKKTDMMMLGIRSLEDFKKVLNPDQKKMLKDMLAMDSGEMEDMESEPALEGAE